MKKTPNYIKKTLLEAKEELQKNKKLSETRELYIQKLKEIFKDRVVELKSEVKTKMSSTGTGQEVVELGEPVKTIVKPTSSNKRQLSEKVIFLNNEIVSRDLNYNEIDEANNDLIFNDNDKIIELKDEIDDDKIIEPKDEVDDDKIVEDEIENKTSIENEGIVQNPETLVDTQDVVEESFTIDKSSEETEDILNNNIQNNNDDEINELHNGQLEILNEKINDLDLNSNELSEKIDELLDQKNLFSEKFNDELDIKLSEALNRTEDNLESKLNSINNVYHEEFGKHEDEVNKNFAHLENQINQLSDQYNNIENNINSISTKIESGTEQSNSIEPLEIQFENRINDLKNHNIKIEESLNEINKKITETLEKIQSVKTTSENQIYEVTQSIKDIEPEIIKNIEDKQKNKTESEKLQDKFDQLSKVMDLQNMRMLQMYHSSELQHSHSILQNNMQQTNLSEEKTDVTSKLIKDQMKEELFPKIQDEMDKQFKILKDQLSEYEIKSVLDKIGSTDISKEAKKPIKKFSNLFDAKKYVKNIVSTKSRNWIKENESTIEEIAKKLLNK